MGESGRYMYAVTRGVEPAALGEVGLDGGPLEVVEEDGLAAVVSSVDLAEYGEDGLRRHLEDLEWLERVARAHDSVVQAVSRLGPVAPLRLATICLDEDGVRARLREWGTELRSALDRVADRVEWSVKVYMPGSVSRTVSVPDAEPARPADARRDRGLGTDYLRRKRTASDARRTAEEHGARVAAEIHEELARRSVAARVLAAQDPRLTGHEGTMTLNGAYLVAAADADAFAEHVEQLAGGYTEVRVESHGPWPPYSFATLEQP
ncbi:MAG TPA: GvpL/GvpF family gas vesicle protein [Nocardioidaceae bacterium]|nr:GvpL/GvpF family gas vesicle protein [Nocardioidaceae bacterium]